MSAGKTVPQALAATIGSLMNGEALPHPESGEFRQLMNNIEAFLKEGTACDQAELGCLAMGQLIAAGSAHVKTTQVLLNVGGPE